MVYRKQIVGPCPTYEHLTSAVATMYRRLRVLMPFDQLSVVPAYHPSQTCPVWHIYFILNPYEAQVLKCFRSIREVI